MNAKRFLLTWEEGLCICLQIQLIAIVSRTEIENVKLLYQITLYMCLLMK